ncbi:MAG: ATP-binding domain-containing protein [Paludibacter sp.]
MILGNKYCFLNRTLWDWWKLQKLRDQPITHNALKKYKLQLLGQMAIANEQKENLALSLGKSIMRYDKIDELEDVTLAYAITIHKSQGSEYPVVIIPVTLQHRIMLQRNLLYTAMTRARQRLFFVGMKQALTYAVQNERVSQRYSMLAELLKDILR